MEITYRSATFKDAQLIATLVMELTHEIGKLTHARHFTIQLEETKQRCQTLIREGHYHAILAFSGDRAIALATLSETYALYAGGKVGVIQECYVSPEYRGRGVGAMLMAKVKAHAKTHHLACIELCTPPLPEFNETLHFYQKNGLIPVGGRKMRQSFNEVIK